VYSGDGSFNTSTGALTGGQDVNKANSNTALASSVNPSVFGQSVTFTATLTAVGPGAGTPGGTVQFTIDGTNFGTPVTLAGGAASTTTAALAVGNHTVGAVYSGDASFNNSSGTLTGGQNVNKAGTSTALGSSANPSVFGQAVSFTATVTAVGPGAGAPSGTVQFTIDGANFGTAVTLAGGTASSTATAALAVGNHTVTAVYSGDGSFNTNTGTLTGGQVVNKASISAPLASSVNPSVFGQAVAFTASVSVVTPGAGTPTGTIQFKIDGTDLGTPVALAGGTASSTAASSMAAGNHIVTAVYSGDGSFNTYTGTLTGGQVVNKTNTTTTLASSVNPVPYLQAVTFTATVAAVAPGAGVPSGTVQFTIDGTNLGTPVTLAGGSATSQATSTLTLDPGSGTGDHQVSAVYSGDASFNGSTGAPLTETVKAVPPVVESVPTANPAPAMQGSGVAFSVLASDPNGLPFTYTWDFGDGSTGTGASVTHAFINPGTYSAKVTITNSVSLSVTGTVSVTVAAGLLPAGVFVDDDGDGFPSEVEQALGSSPTDATNTPFAMAPVPPAAKSLTISKMAVSLSFSPKTPTGKDSLAVAGLLPISSGFSPAGQHVIVDVGGVVKSWVLDAKGKGKAASKYDLFSVGFKAAKKGGVVAAQNGKYAVTLKSGTFAAKLAAYGYDNADHKAAITLQVPVAIIFNGNIYEALATQHYKSAKNKSGSSK
jgi:hypothetical protein